LKASFLLATDIIMILHVLHPLIRGSLLKQSRKR